MIYPDFLLPYQDKLNIEFNASFDANDIEQVKKYYGFKNIAWCQQTHQDKIFIVDQNNLFNDTADAMITTETNIPLLIRTADCLAVILFDPKKNIIANIHAGWRGQANMIITKTIQILINNFGSNPNTLMAVSSPSLGKCCAEFSNPYQELPEHLHSFIIKNNYVDLKKACYEELINNGLLTENIYINQVCTKCQHSKWFSVRYNQAKQRIINLVWLKEPLINS